jgi:hypothetical protein
MALDAAALEDAATPPDAGFRDAESPDAAVEAGPDAGPTDLGPPDSGYDVCPSADAGGCARANDCTPDLSPPTNCAACTPYNRALCLMTTCDRPAVLQITDVYDLTFSVSPDLTGYAGFAAYVVDTESSNGLRIGCADVYAGTVDLSNRCYNVLDSRGYDVGQAGNTFDLTFTGFAASVRAMFVIYAYAEQNQQGQRLGVSCTEVMVESPGGGRQIVQGDTMRRL